MLKVLLVNGSFENPEEEKEEVVGEVKADEDGGEETVVVSTKGRKIDPMSILRKVDGHKVYEMLKI